MEAVVEDDRDWVAEWHLEYGKHVKQQQQQEIFTHTHKWIQRKLNEI